MKTQCPPCSGCCDQGRLCPESFKDDDALRGARGFVLATVGGLSMWLAVLLVALMW